MPSSGFVVVTTIFGFSLNPSQVITIAALGVLLGNHHHGMVIGWLLATMVVITIVLRTEAGGHVMAWWSLDGPWQP